MINILTRVKGLSRRISNSAWYKLTGVYRYPINVHVEINNTCNLNCIMCPRDTLTRPLGLMKDELYQSMIKQLERMKVKRANLFLFGEPLVHPRLCELIEYARRHGIAPLINTNGLALTEEKSRVLLHSGLETMIFSVDAVTPELYREIRRGGELDVVQSNILRFLELRRDTTERKPQVVMQYAVSRLNAHEVEPFRAFWEEKVDRVHFTKVNEYGGIENLKVYEYHTKNRRPCPDTWSKMVILADGRVNTCCLDVNGELAMGDANTTPLLSIWRGESWRRLRKDHRALRFDRWPICDKCPMPLLYAENIAETDSS